METILATAILTIVVLGISVLGMAIKVFLTPQGEFKGGCASNNPMFRDKVGACGVCGCPGGRQGETWEPLERLGVRWQFGQGDSGQEERVRRWRLAGRQPAGAQAATK